MSKRKVQDLASILIEELMGFHGLGADWTYAWHDKGDSAGRTFVESKLLTFNRRILLNTAPGNIREAILHEIAHVLVHPNKSHDQEWYDKLIEIGGTGVWVFDNGHIRSVKPN